MENHTRGKVIIKFIGSYFIFMKRIINAVTIALSVMLIVACGRPSVPINERERENYERILAGGTIECAFGLDGNGSCVKEGEEGIWPIQVPDV